MAIRGADGSIVLTTSVDQSGLNRGMNTMRGSVNSIQSAFTKLGRTIATVFSIHKIINFSKAASSLATDTEASVQRIIDIYGSASKSVSDFIDSNARALGMSKAAATSFAAVYGNLFSVWADRRTNAELTNKYLNTTAVVASKTGRKMQDVQERIRSGLLGNTEAVEDLGIFVNIKTIEITEAFQRIADGRSWDKLSAYEQAQVRALAILEQATKKYGNEVAQTTSLTRARYNAAYEDFKNTWGIVVNRILMPVLKVLTNIFNYATSALQAIFKISGKSITVNNDSFNEQSQAIGTAVENQNNLTDAIKETEKAQRKSILGFDELNVLSEKTNENMDNSDFSDSFNMSDFDSPMSNTSFDESADEFDLSQYDELFGRLEAIGVLATAIGASLLAWRISEALMNGTLTLSGILGKFSGIIMMIAGAILLVKGYSDAWVNGVDWDNMSEIMLGILLLVTGIALAISPVAAAFVTVGLGIAMVVLALKDMATNGINVKNVLTLVAGAAMTVVAILTAAGKLTFFGTLLPMLALIAGAFITIKGATDAWVNGVDWSNLATLISGVAIAVTAIAVSSAPLYTAIALVVGGIVMLVVGLRDMISNGANAKNTILTLAGAITTAIGAVMLISRKLGKSLSPSVYMAVAGFAALAVGIGAVISQWNNMNGAERVASVLGLLAVAAASAAIAFGSLQSAWSLGVAAAAIIAGIVAITGAVESASSRADAALTGLDDTAYGNYATDFTQYVPKLAKGAVIPPNREFLAVLGDQKSGTNIEAPLDTIKQAFRDELNNMGSMQNETVTNINFTGNLAQLARVLKPQIERETLRQGTKMITGGSY